MSYSLYFNKKEKELIIEAIKNNPYMESKIIVGKAVWYNDCYYVSDSRKLLREKGKELQKQWIEETEEDLRELKEMKIKTKY
ncbi:hypothetical protein IRP63_14200 (plasmid) [Clostridium botulinum]|uniref:Uncharacterized protein n=2 Tax=Clostridium botulinum TaxID=1491 RepID=A0A0A0HZN2_CLOBO|nr:hypothetical protein Z955_14885 [Clostridium botulinum C/D str. DC5]KOC56859.1 hypothetical protein ADU89_01280 [Clostridium botulinum]MCD3232563.1 hypothetical protein [Clostridium botulinum D/C]KGN01653.1 hypothetical protein Z955_01100 [Clostridium botulinum C/D str. DC5]KOC57334.1 hypothetical protein ADU90_05820 [Clostridium botulinum]